MFSCFLSRRSEMVLGVQWAAEDEVTATWEDLGDCRRWHTQYRLTSVGWSLAKVRKMSQFPVSVLCTPLSSFFKFPKFHILRVFCPAHCDIVSLIWLLFKWKHEWSMIRYSSEQIFLFHLNKWMLFGLPPLRETDEKRGTSDHPSILPPGLMYTAQVAFIGLTKGLMTGIMRVMWH